MEHHALHAFLLIGELPGIFIHQPVPLIQKKELNIFGSRNALKKDFLQLIDLVKEGMVDLDKIVTNTYKFDDAAAAFADFDKNAASMLKVIFEF